MASLFAKIKKALGFYPKASYYKIEEKTGEPVKVTYSPQAEPVAPEIEEPISSQDAAVDTKDDGIDLAAMTKTDLLLFAREKGLAVTSRMKKQELIDVINASL